MGLYAMTAIVTVLANIEVLTLIEGFGMEQTLGNVLFSATPRLLLAGFIGSTLISRILNTVLFSVIAFFGIYKTDTLLIVVLSSYVIYIFTSLLDTAIVYAAGRLKEKGRIPSEV